MQQLSTSAALASLMLFGLIAGFFYAFSVDVMRGLDLIEAHESIRAMQGINTAVRNPVFFVTFFLTPLVAIITAAILLKTGLKTSAILMAAAAVIYLAGAFLPTVMINVPMNEALGTLSVSPGDQGLVQVWDDYSSKWTFWNTARTVASTISLILAGLSLANLQTVKSVV